MEAKDIFIPPDQQCLRTFLVEIADIFNPKNTLQYCPQCMELINGTLLTILGDEKEPDIINRIKHYSR